MKVGEPYHHQNLRGALLAAALDLIRQKGGSHGFTLRAVARRAGVSHTAPYRHFRNKDDLLGAIAEEGFLRLAVFLRAAVAKDWYPVRRLRKVWLQEQDRMRTARDHRDRGPGSGHGMV